MNRKFKNLILYVGGIFCIIICKIVNIFFDFKFFHLPTARIGHQVINFDAVVSCLQKNTTLLVSHDLLVANNFILNFFKKQKKTIFFQLFRYVTYSILLVNKKSKFVLDWNEFNPKFSYYFNHYSKSKIEFPYYSNEKLKEIFLKLNIKKNFVGLHARDDYYVNKYRSEDKNFHTYRNFNFEDYDLVINYLTKNNNSIIKLGENYPDKKNSPKKKNIISLSDLDYRYDEIDYLINSYSKYNIIGNTGISGIATMHRKKILYVNFIPFSLDHLSKLSPCSIVLPKKIFDDKKNRLLSYKEMLNIDIDIHNTIDPYNINNLTVINNTPKEILYSTIEMENFIKFNKRSKECVELNNFFWNNIAKINGKYKQVDYLKNELKITISSFFLKNNKDLF